MQTINEALEKLKKSPFRSKFRLTEQNKAYIDTKGIDTVQRHAYDFVKTRLAPSYIPNDGKQTPYRGHPVFKAQHACDCCCGKCLCKWYNVPENTALNESNQEKIVTLLMQWIPNQPESL